MIKDSQQLKNGFHIAAQTDTGLQRQRNEDSFGISTELNLALLADGMGGYVDGDIASEMAIQNYTAGLQLLTQQPEPGAYQKLKNWLTATLLNGSREKYKDLAKQYTHDLVLGAHHQICANQQQNHFRSDMMGTTLAGIWFWSELPDHAVIFHVGDSRIYRFRDQQLEQLTKDHSLLQYWLDNNQEGSRPSANLIMQALGVGADPKPDIGIIPIHADDRFLICSDGLTAMVEDEEIEKMMGALKKDNLADICHELIEKANENGGQDNITVMLICVDDNHVE